VPLESGEIAEDVARYLHESEQTPSALALGVFVGGDGVVEAAGGFLVQALPGAADEALARLESNVADLPTPTQLVRGGLCADDVVDRLLAGLGSRERTRSRPAFHCRCGRDRILRAVVLLGREEVRELTARGEPLEVRCEFCGDRYELSPDELGALVPDA
jgi:molecular chaperone Hsp33